MTEFQLNALLHPLARAGGLPQQRYHRTERPWSIMLTVNK
jgi:hypothetical protein